MLVSVGRRMTATDFSEAAFNAMSFGSILILTALGLAITFGVMRVINMAHGEMLMLGAYTAFVVTDPGFLGLSFFWAIPASFVAVGIAGYVLEVCLIRFLYGRPLDTLLATWGVSMILQQIILLTFGADLKPVHVPEVIDGHWEIAGFTVPTYRVFIAAVTAMCLVAVYLLFHRTAYGLKVRAVTQNRPMASALGISTRRIDSMTFAFATGLAGVAGCIFSGLYTVKYNMGPDYVVEAFMTVIMGGMGQLSGTVVSGALLGTGDSFVEKILVNAPMAKVAVLLSVVLFIMVRPAGIFVSKERSYD
jgi:urea transport system permease protein